MTRVLSFVVVVVKENFLRSLFAEGKRLGASEIRICMGDRAEVRPGGLGRSNGRELLTMLSVVTRTSQCRLTAQSARCCEKLIQRHTEP